MTLRGWNIPSNSMNSSFEQTLIEVWRQALVEDAKPVELGTERDPVRASAVSARTNQALGSSTSLGTSKNSMCPQTSQLKTRALTVVPMLSTPNRNTEGVIDDLPV